MGRLEGRHRAVGGNALRAAVLGANDGLCSNLSLVMGVARRHGLRARTVGLSLVPALAHAISVHAGHPAARGLDGNHPAHVRRGLPRARPRNLGTAVVARRGRVWCRGGGRDGWPARREGARCDVRVRGGVGPPEAGLGKGRSMICRRDRGVPGVSWSCQPMRAGLERLVGAAAGARVVTKRQRVWCQLGLGMLSPAIPPLWSDQRDDGLACDALVGWRPNANG